VMREADCEKGEEPPLGGGMGGRGGSCGMKQPEVKNYHIPAEIQDVTWAHFWENNRTRTNGACAVRAQEEKESCLVEEWRGVVENNPPFALCCNNSIGTRRMKNRNYLSDLSLSLMRR
jgi:hypothetical protein